MFSSLLGLQVYLGLLVNLMTLSRKTRRLNYFSCYVNWLLMVMYQCKPLSSSMQWHNYMGSVTSTYTELAIQICCMELKVQEK